MKVALVIGAGVVKCAAALGLWKALHRARIEIDRFVGCSGGALFAATMALGFDLEECIEKTQHLWDPRITAKRHYPSLVRAFLPGLFGFDTRFGMIHDRPLLDSLQTAFSNRTFAEASIPLSIVASDFKTGEPVVLTQGLLVDTLRANIAPSLISGLPGQ